jgi:hypothetical protein
MKGPKGTGPEKRDHTEYPFPLAAADLRTGKDWKRTGRGLEGIDGTYP